MLKSGSAWRMPRGFSLVELMTATAIGLLVISGIVFVLFETTRAVRHVLSSAHLRQTQVTVMSIMTSELRRAGYWSRAGLAPDTMANRFAGIHRVGDDCLLYSYDQQHDDPDGIPDPEDQHGLRLANGVLQIKTSDTACGPAVCSTCDSGHWLALTDPNTVTITGLTFGDHREPLIINDAGAAVEVRRIDINVAGRHRDDPDIHHRLHASVDIRNDELH